MSEPCKYGCWRDRLIREVVNLQLAASDAGDAMLAIIQNAREHGRIDDDVVAALLREHETLSRPVAADLNKSFDERGSQPGQHRPWRDGELAEFLREVSTAKGAA